MLWVSAWGTWWRSWLRHGDTSQKVMGSIPNGVFGIFHLRNASGRTMGGGWGVVWLIQPPTEMNTRNISWG